MNGDGHLSEKVYDILIAGGGPCGYTAALYASRYGLSNAVIEKSSPGGQMCLTDVVDNYPGFPDGINGYELSIKMKEGAERFGTVTQNAEIINADIGGTIKILTASDGTVFSSRSLIIATGAVPKRLGLKGEEHFTGKGFSYCATCDGMFFKGKPVAVIGGGNTAAEYAVFLSAICSEVFLIHRRNHLTADTIYADVLKKCPNVKYFWDSEAVEIHGGQSVTGLTVKNKKEGKTITLKCGGIFSAIGYIPNAGIFKDMLSLDDKGYITAGENTETEVKGVFAAGDVRSKPLHQILTACSDGANAAKSAQTYLNTVL